MAITLSLLLGGQAASAQTASSVDWKLYGSVTLGQDRQFCFYDAQGIAKTAEGYVRVWTKCLPQREIDSVDIEKEFGDQIVENVAEKIIRHYVPPISTIEDTDRDQLMTVIRYEGTANIANIQPKSRIFYELKCSDRMIRELSIFVRAKDKIGSSDKPSEWKYIPPEGSAASLSKLLCH